MPSVEPAQKEAIPAPPTAPAPVDRSPRVSWRRVAVVAGAAAAALLAWQAITTVGRWFPGDSGVYLLNAWWLDRHGTLPPAYVSYEYPAPPLYEAVTVGLDHLVRAVPSWPLELPWNPATRLIWFLLVVGSFACLTATKRLTRRIGVAGIALAVLWGLDEAISLGKTADWSSGQLVSFASAAGLVPSPR